MLSIPGASAKLRAAQEPYLDNSPPECASSAEYKVALYYYRSGLTHVDADLASSIC